jgi:hypothetical protein
MNGQGAPMVDNRSIDPLALAMNTDASRLGNRSASLPNAANTAGVGGHFLGANDLRAAFSTSAHPN